MQSRNVVALVLLLVGCSSSSNQGGIGSLHLIGYQSRIDLADSSAVFGGISGLDYVAEDKAWLLLSDDRAVKGPMRIYRASLTLDESFQVSVTGYAKLLAEDGSLLPAPAAGHSPDPEALRYDPATRLVYWTSEGDRDHGEPPALNLSTVDGASKGSVPLPARYVDMTAGRGPRHNGSLEGLSFDASGKNLVLAMELPLFEDGPAPSAVDTTSPTRILELDRSGKTLVEYAYELDPVRAAPTPADGFVVNGIAEILAVDTSHYLVLERSFSAGQGHSVRLYEIDTEGATDVSRIDSLIGADYQPVKKRELVDFGALGLPTVNNIEGMSFGPLLASGKRSLVVVSDDNFAATQVTQFITFEVQP